VGVLGDEEVGTKSGIRPRWCRCGEVVRRGGGCGCGCGCGEGGVEVVGAVGGGEAGYGECYVAGSVADGDVGCGLVECHDGAVSEDLLEMELGERRNRWRDGGLPIRSQ